MAFFSLTRSRLNPLQRLIARQDLVALVSIAFVIWASGAFQDILWSRGSPIYLAGWLSFGGLSLFFIHRNRIPVDTALIANWQWGGLVILAGLSIIWSQSPAASAKSMILFVISGLVAIAGAYLLRKDQILSAMRIALTIILVLSLFMIVFVPSIGQSIIAHHGDSWSGVFKHRSLLAGVAVLAAILALTDLFTDFRPKIGAAVRLLVSYNILVFTNSKMSLLSGTVALIAVVAFRFLQDPKFGRMRFSPGFVVTVFISGLFAMVGLALVVLPYVFALVGRGESLSGRTRMWSWGFDIASDHPILGAGFDVFWRNPLLSYLISIDRAWLDVSATGGGLSQLQNGHNGYLDIYFNLGLVGITLFAVFLVTFFVRALKALSSRREPFDIFATAFFIYFAMRNITETIFLEANRLEWTILVLFFLVLGRTQGRIRTNAPPRSPSLKS